MLYRLSVVLFLFITISFSSNSDQLHPSFEITLTTGSSYSVETSENGVTTITHSIVMKENKLITIIELIDGIPVSIYEQEQKVLSDDLSGFDDDEVIFTASIKVIDWAKDELIIKKTGKRMESEEGCSVFEYEGLIEEALKLRDGAE